MIDEYTKQMYMCYQELTGGAMHVSVDDFIKLRKEAVKEVQAGFHVNNEIHRESKQTPKSEPARDNVQEITPRQSKQPRTAQPERAKEKPATIKPIHQQEEMPQKEAVNAFSILRGIPDNWN